MSERATEETAGAPRSGAHFLKCALHVNPYAYVVRHSKSSDFANEEEYNEAIVAALRRENVTAIAVTDHFRIYPSECLMERVRAAGITVFPGFEAKTKEGIHLLCLFDPEEPLSFVANIIASCGIHDDEEASPIGDHDFDAFLAKSRKWRAICVAAHVWQNGGLLNVLSGQSRVRAWKSSNLFACSIPGCVDDSPVNYRKILKNKNADYRRERPVAIVNAQDVSDPDHVSDPGSTTWIKMSEATLDGLRQAFLDPESRIRLNSDPPPQNHAELVELKWEGGFLDGEVIHFNPNLNVLVGGRGAGKSTAIESLRHVLDLDPLGEEARKTNERMVSNVVRSGTKISLRMRTWKPSQREYLVERIVPNPPTVRDGSGKLLPIHPKDIWPNIEVYGQHEISELARSPEKSTLLLRRFAQRDEEVERRRKSVVRELESTRRSLTDVRTELQQIDESMSALPQLEELERRFASTGYEERLRDQSLLVREEGVIASIEERLRGFADVLESVHQELPIDRTFLSERALQDLPGKGILVDADTALAQLSTELTAVLVQFGEALEKSQAAVAQVRSRWDERKRSVEDDFNRILRQLKEESVDAVEFMRVKREIESLNPLRVRRPLLVQLQEEHEKRRRSLLEEWEELKAAECRLLGSAAKRVNRKLHNRVNVDVTASGDREPLFALLRDKLGGRLSEAVAAIRQSDDVSIPEFVDCCRAGSAALRRRFAIPDAQAERVAGLPPEVLMLLEELELPSTTEIQLNTGPPDAPVWQALAELSTGQKATALLLLLLLESDAPLIVDQPEDDLDNRFVTEGIVPKMREEKRRRQFVFSTHNANIPVLGDAELILGLTPSGEGEAGKAAIRPEHIGSLDDRSVRELVEGILEGGREAFETRRLKYGF